MLKARLIVTGRHASKRTGTLRRNAQNPCKDWLGTLGHAWHASNHPRRGGERKGDHRTDNLERLPFHSDFKISASSFLSSLGRRGTALGRFWDGSKHAESSMIARLGTAGRLGEGGVWVCGGSSLLWRPKTFVWSADFVVLSESFRTLPNLSEV